jgi:hypothetical protein
MMREWEDFASVPRLEGDGAYRARNQLPQGGTMSEDEARRGHEEETGDVEAHSRRAANEEAPDEARRENDDDDVEAHVRRAAPDAEGGRSV